MDFHDTYALVTKLRTIHFVLGIAIAKDWKLIQLDVNNAFLHGELHETIYMDLSLGMTSTKIDQVCLLHKSLYGLCQASHKWYAQLSSYLLKHDFKQSSANHSLFIQRDHDKTTIILVYVDDIIVTGNNPKIIQNIIVT